MRMHLPGSSQVSKSVYAHFRDQQIRDQVQESKLKKLDQSMHMHTNNPNPLRGYVAKLTHTYTEY